MRVGFLHSGMDVTISISDVKIDEVQWEAAQTLLEPILAPHPSGNYEVDESVKACRVRSPSTE